MGYKKKYSKLLFFFTGSLYLLLALLTAETASRLFSGRDTSVLSYDTLTGWRFNTSKREINSHGFRDFEPGFPEEGQRILILGDSYTVGLHIPLKDAFPKRISAYGEETEVITAAVPGWATDQHYIYLKNEGVKHQPGYVIICLSPNDIRESYSKKFHWGENYLENGFRVSLFDRMMWYFSKKSVFFQVIQGVVGTEFGEFSHISSLVPFTFPIEMGRICRDIHLFREKIPSGSNISSAYGYFDSLLYRAHTLCREQGIKLILTVMPTKMEFFPPISNDAGYIPGKVSRHVAEFSERNGILFIDLFDVFFNYEDPISLFLEDGYHLNEKGHIFVAEALKEVLFNEL